MGWQSGDITTIFIQGVIPLVVGIGLCVLSALYVVGILKFRCCKKHEDQVAPVVVVTGAGRTNGQNNDNDHGAAPMTRAQAERAYGPVACEANLWGMSPKERHAVLEVIFSKCDTHKNVASNRHNDNMSNNNKIPPESDVEVGDVSSHQHLDITCSCAICLRRYEENDEILTGSNCSHMFHKQCAMVWLTNFKKPKDHCPYCRNEMVTPDEMKTAALDVLGEDRVRELTDFERANNNQIDNQSDNYVTIVMDVENDIIRDV